MTMAKEQISKLENDLKIIEQFLMQDLRVTKYMNSEGVQQITVDNIEEQEDKKLYHEWVEQQGKRLGDKPDLVRGSQAPPGDQIVQMDEKERLYHQIQGILDQSNAVKLGKGSQGLSYFQLIQKQKQDVYSSHKHFGSVLNQNLFKVDSLKSFEKQDLYTQSKT